jgi:hypothetical protein
MKMKTSGGDWPMESVDPPGNYKIAYAPQGDKHCILTGSYSATPAKPSTGEIVIVMRDVPLADRDKKVAAVAYIKTVFDDHWITVQAAKK